MKTRTKLALSLTVVAAVLGFMVSVQYKQQLMNRADTALLTPRDPSQQKLIDQLNALKESNASAEKQLSKLTGQLNQYEQQSAGGNSALEQLQTRLQDERILAGVTPVEGPGITVTLMDGVSSGTNTESVLTHDWDVRQVINELFTAGAEAVSINGYRVVATSGIFCTGPVVEINGHRIGAPFQIEAIGDPKALQSAMTIQGGILDSLRNRGVNASSPQIEANITMAAATVTLSAETTNGN